MRGTRILALVLVAVLVLGTAGTSAAATTDTTADLSVDTLQDGDDGMDTNETDGDDNETDAGDNETLDEDASDGAAYAFNLTAYIEELKTSNETEMIGPLVASFAVSNNPGEGLTWNWSKGEDPLFGPDANVTRGPAENATGPPDDAGPPEEAGSDNETAGPPDDAGPPEDAGPGSGDDAGENAGEDAEDEAGGSDDGAGGNGQASVARW